MISDFRMFPLVPTISRPFSPAESGGHSAKSLLPANHPDASGSDCLLSTLRTARLVSRAAAPASPSGSQSAFPHATPAQPHREQVQPPEGKRRAQRPREDNGRASTRAKNFTGPDSTCHLRPPGPTTSVSYARSRWEVVWGVAPARGGPLSNRRTVAVLAYPSPLRHQEAWDPTSTPLNRHSRASFPRPGRGEQRQVGSGSGCAEPRGEECFWGGRSPRKLPSSAFTSPARIGAQLWMAAFLVGPQPHATPTPDSLFCDLLAHQVPHADHRLPMSEVPDASDALLKMTLHHDHLAETQFSHLSHLSHRVVVGAASGTC